ncbi:NAD-dependent epimerase/dehydratase family protein [Dictyobacter formicarum]|uniref:3-beta hydroxysteroid dehydrogenase n=1 Tax=Dictyobacter formicarum TaxID=2778368 RepID=A0ABQ3VA88_9CHLR|nr:NAD-dependent epimerase/dehydratase family protein [Dictyobacter formicarum]GHO82792.1 3-beta hydroxysteroid dehydrogenase [Dictyobacter formicarum]
MKVLVTGATGFLGKRLVELLVERGDEVRALALPQEDISNMEQKQRIEIVEGDITDPATVARATKGVQRIYHLAARTGPWGAAEEVYRSINVAGLANILHASHTHNIERLIHVSSTTVYGHHLQGLITEEHCYRAEDNPYSRSKIAGERLLADLSKDLQVPVVTIRPGWIYGPGDSASFGRLVAQIETRRAFLFGSGQNIVPIVYVDDVAQSLILAGDAGKHAIGQSYTIVNDQRVTQFEYLNTIAQALQVPSISQKVPLTLLMILGRSSEKLWKLAGRQTTSPPPITTYGITLLGCDQRFSIEKARRELGYQPAFDVQRGVAAGMQWYLASKYKHVYRLSKRTR